MAEWWTVHTQSGSRLLPGDPQQTGAELRAEFRSVFEREAAGVWFAPGRANLNGEHIDFHGGRCLPMALSHGTYVTAAPREDGVLRLRTLDPGLDDGVRTVTMHEIRPLTSAARPSPEQNAGNPSVREDEEPVPPGDSSGLNDDWTRYVSGVLWSLQQLGRERSEFAVPEGFGADLLVSSTLPIGGGLSSSAALECASMLAFVALATPAGAAHPQTSLNTALTDEHRALLARACMRAEVEVVGAGTGGLDQTVSLRGAAGHLLALDCRDFSVEQLPLEPLLREHTFLAVDTGQAHWLGDGKFGARRADAESAAELLGLQRLRDALPQEPSPDDVDHVLAEFDRLAAGLEDSASEVVEPKVWRRRLQHALTEMVRSEQLRRLLAEPAGEAAEPAAQIGAIMAEGHSSMREDAEVSFELADQVVETACSAGALGARLIGGGFGGSVLTLLPRRATDEVLDAVSALSPGIRVLEPVPSAPARAL